MPKGRILVVEDDKDNRELILFLLQKADYETLTAIDGGQGMQMALTYKPDLILLDLTIPGLDGWKLAGRLKKHAELKAIPVIAVTGHTLPGDRRQAIESGCDGYITKPLDVTTFLLQVEAFL